MNKPKSWETLRNIIIALTDKIKKYGIENVHVYVNDTRKVQN